MFAIPLRRSRVSDLQAPDPLYPTQKAVAQLRVDMAQLLREHEAGLAIIDGLRVQVAQLRERLQPMGATTNTCPTWNFDGVHAATCPTRTNSFTWNSVTPPCWCVQGVTISC